MLALATPLAPVARRALERQRDLCVTQAHSALAGAAVAGRAGRLGRAAYYSALAAQLRQAAAHWTFTLRSL